LSRREIPRFSRIISPGAGTPPQHTDRREQRLDVQLPVTVYGFATTGKLFVEHCSTRNISHSGCCIRLRTQPQADSVSRCAYCAGEFPPREPHSFYFKWPGFVKTGTAGWLEPPPSDQRTFIVSPSRARLRRLRFPANARLLGMFYRRGSQEKIFSPTLEFHSSSPTYLNRSGSDRPCHPLECGAAQPRGFGVLSQRLPLLLRDEAIPL